MLSSVIELNVIDRIAIITFNRPASANALSEELLNELEEKITKIERDHSIYCTIFTGKATRAFSAGADLKERINMTDEQTVVTVRLIGHIALKIEKMRMPTIAAINGVAFGGGLELALACDFRIIANHAQVGLTETALGIIPGAGGTQRLSRLVGLGQAKRLIYLALKLSANEAYRIGLVEEIVQADKLMDHAIKQARIISKNGPISLSLAKSALNQGYQTDLATALEIEHLSYLQTLNTKDRHEGLKAFVEKRDPSYRGK